MIIECTTCGAKYKYDEAKLAGAESKKLKCPKCKGIIEVVNQKVRAAAALRDPDSGKWDSTFTTMTSPAGAPSAESSPTDPADTAVPGESPKTSKLRKEMLEGLKLPETRKLSIAVISGNNAGEIYPISKPRMVIGRGEADILIQDLEASRTHAEIDVIGDRVVLHDLNSTNGTFVDEQKITSVTLENHSEFRIGSTVFMLIITDIE
ncbi:zinc-ribbon domain-containing protein [bacterium]|nr:zinc-ribbon domain-containing protein [bacterium]MCI0615032.1 zinc-ribbon domain-containing protein [bacterium]